MEGEIGGEMVRQMGGEVGEWRDGLRDRRIDGQEDGQKLNG